jgi:glutamyl-tRNA reductase
VSVVVVGLNHRTVPLDVLERMTVNDAMLPKALHDLSTREHLTEALVLSTCMRTEIYAVAARFHGAVLDVRTFLSEWSDTSPDAFTDHLYTYYEDSAVAHLFRVASGLDSAVIGEGEILGQVKDAWEMARTEQAGRRSRALGPVPPRRRGGQAGPLRDRHLPWHHVGVASRSRHGRRATGLAGGQAGAGAGCGRDG